MMVDVSSEELEGMPESQAPFPPAEDRITSRDAVKAFGVTAEQLASWRARGRISFWKMGYWVIMSRSELAAYVADVQTLRPGRVLPSYEPPEPKEPGSSS